MIYDLSQYSVSYLIRNSSNVKNDDLQAKCNAHTNNSCKITKSSSPRVTTHEQINFNKLCLVLNMTSSRGNIPFDRKTKQFTDTDFCIGGTNFQAPTWRRGQ